MFPVSQSLSDDGEFSTADFRRTEKVPASDGKFYETAIYNLEVLNKLGMCCFRGNKKAKEIRDKFNDVLVKHETQTKTKSNAVTTSKPLEKSRGFSFLSFLWCCLRDTFLTVL